MASVGRVLGGKATQSFGMHRIGGRREAGDTFLPERSPVGPRLTTGGRSRVLCNSWASEPGMVGGTACTPEICLPWFQEAPRVQWTDQEEGLGHLANPIPCARGYPPNEGATACAARNEN